MLMAFDLVPYTRHDKVEPEPTRICHLNPKFVVSVVQHNKDRFDRTVSQITMVSAEADEEGCGTNDYYNVLGDADHISTLLNNAEAKS